MPDGIIPKEEFEKITEQDVKFNYLYSLCYELYKKKQYDSIKTIFGGFLGGFVAMVTKMAIWR